MARKKKLKPEKEGAAWLITFSDMMTLMLTFFVLLVSMATLDERRKLIVIGSIISTFGMAPQGYDVRSIENKRTTVEPGPMNDMKSNDLEPLKNLLFEDTRDLDFRSNKFIQVLSINDRLLFEPGRTELSEAGKRFINRLLPILIDVDFPLLLAGHTSSLRDEEGEQYKVSFDATQMDESWRLSLFRVLSIYRHLVDRGMDPDLLRVESFGRYHPMYNGNTPEGRQKNRRVDIVLDKRNVRWSKALADAQEKGGPDDREFSFRDFLFDLRGGGGRARPGTEP
ncbi:MAG: flagellar motor protein MotB [Desulfovibrionaceae bacterium]|jgi:chemotaxis protein MotB|nr:flagellar motor protein MotB [Desulfovibrionaceae bacterium]